jgi:hypothetical protein
MILSASAVFLASCGTVKSYNFKRGGTLMGDSSYLVTASGVHIDAADIDVKPGSVTVNGKPYPLDDLSAIRSKGMYFGVSDKKIYLGEFYGKINILYQLINVPTYSNYGPNSGMSNSAFGNTMVTGHTTQRKYYIQKSGSTNIDRMTVGTVIDYVSDNEEALRVAKGAKNWKTGYLLSWAGLAAGTIYGFKSVFSTQTDASGSIKPVSFAGATAVLIPSLAGATVSSYMYNNRMLKAVEIYNK